MSDMEVIYYGNDNMLELRGLKNAASGAYENSATVEVTLKDDDGAEVTGETWPLALGYVSGSDGNYRNTLKDTLSLVENEKYTAEITANAGAGLLGYWEIPIRCRMRTS